VGWIVQVVSVSSSARVPLPSPTAIHVVVVVHDTPER
jgi:hypothetical protein